MKQYALIERTDAKQPFHVVFKAGNARKTFTCEQLTTRANAIKAIVALGKTFSPIDKAVVMGAPLLASGLALRVYFGDGDRDYTEVEIRERDSRTVTA